MMVALKNLKRLLIIKNIVQMNAAGRPLIKKSDKSTMMKKRGFLVKKDYVKLVVVKIILADTMKAKNAMNA